MRHLAPLFLLVAIAGAANAERAELPRAPERASAGQLRTVTHPGTITRPRLSVPLPEATRRIAESMEGHEADRKTFESLSPGFVDHVLYSVFADSPIYDVSFFSKPVPVARGLCATKVVGVHFIEKDRTADRNGSTEMTYHALEVSDAYHLVPSLVDEGASGVPNTRAMQDMNSNPNQWEPAYRTRMEDACAQLTRKERWMHSPSTRAATVALAALALAVEHARGFKTLPFLLQCVEDRLPIESDRWRTIKCQRERATLAMFQPANVNGVWLRDCTSGVHLLTDTGPDRDARECITIFFEDNGTRYWEVSFWMYGGQVRRVEILHSWSPIV